GVDTITLGTAMSNGSVDLGTAADKLTFGAFANTAPVAHLESIVGGSLADTITLGTALTTAMSVDLGAGSDKLTLANVANTGTVSNVETIVGGTGADTITLATAITNGSIDLGTGNDSLAL